MTTDREKIAAERSLLKSQFKGLFDKVEEILFRHDPIGIAFVDNEGVADNPDEYAPEVGTILPRLNAATSTGDVVDIVHAEFCRWFDGDETAGPKENYEAASEEIWTAWEQFSDAHRA